MILKRILRGIAFILTAEVMLWFTLLGLSAIIYLVDAIL
jgi:hypothetical protein